ncbi:transcriptional regulator [Janthinobacterium lividum]|uniref:Transcriptional regulator n=1 Tax=Janthinobacterium lividum TaxID=29581 RepID=A0A1E8PNB6_9BURK|nr:transcriptional regulator [Janthinobacterium lividum]
MVKSLHTPSYIIFRHVMADARERQGLTQTELANRLGKPQSFVSKYESGERRLDLVEFLVVCAALGVEAAALFNSILGAIHEHK